MGVDTLGVAVGGALGSLCRWWLSELFAKLGLGFFPWATLLANTSGSFLIGLVATLTGPDGRVTILPELRLAVMVGFCGGYTTFSSFSLQTLVLVQTGNFREAAANVILSVVVCLLAVWLGHLAAVLVNRI
ncbi:MAG: fluoride efflux transporter CrcB [Geminicoccaceae bacterium]|nr:fluoride efflux transporter CrcB [Geminicoccaceae bacterium]MCX8102729.1 fluoride efflux transporter CrcB [Geminicoccaceae bacterium]MDW8370645.1 fluoride efflux transporter CrcB [Geminicoccaceae bacterium]